MPSIPKISILILIHNEEDNLIHLLKRIENQTFKDRISEVIVADNASTDSTKKILMRLTKETSLPLKVIYRNANHIGQGRRQLVDVASEDWLAFIDGDCCPENDWLEKLVGEWNQLEGSCPQLAGVGGVNRLPDQSLLQRVINCNLNSSLLHGFSSQAIKPKRLKWVDHLPTTNCLLKRSAVLDVGNFSEFFSRTGEDLELGLRLNKCGYRLALSPEPAVVNKSATTFVEWCLRMFRFGGAQALVLGQRRNLTTLMCLSPLIILTGLVFTTEIFGWIIALTLLTSLILPHRPRSLSWIDQIKYYGLGYTVFWGTLIPYISGFYWALLDRSIFSPISRRI